MDIVSGLLSAFGLSTAAGLNAYIPLLVIGLTARYTDLIHLSAPYDIITNPLVLIVIAVIAVLDFVGDKIPAVDHALHVVGLVVSPIVGAIVFMAANSTTGSIDPALAAICGLILAGGTHGVRTAARPISTATTAGFGNPVVSFFEDIVSLGLSLLAVVIPALAFVAVVVFAIVMTVVLRRLFRRRQTSQPLQS